MRPRPTFQLTGLLLYLLTVVLEAPVILLRLMIVFFFVQVPLLILGDTPLSTPLWFLIALAPTLWSMLALITPAGSGWWWRQHAGGREPSQRERLAYQDAIEHLQAHSPDKPLPLPASWFVVDEHQPDAGVCGDSLMLSRGLLEVDLPTVLPHELGHLGSFDGRLTAALNRLVLRQAPRPPKDPAEPEDPNREGPAVVENILGLAQVTQKTIEIITGVFIFTFLARQFVKFARGGIALRITAPLWGRYWRAREYAADNYAAQLGQADELADFLETHALIHDHPMPFVWMTDHSHPPTELRIDRLRNYTHQPIHQTAQPVVA